MGDQMRPHAAVRELYQVEPRRTRGKGEVRDADKVPAGDAVAMSFQCIKRTPKQTGSDLAVDAFCLSKSEPGSRRAGSQTANSKFDQKTAGKYQDVELQHP